MSSPPTSYLQYREFLISLQDNSQSVPLVRATLETLLKFLNWIPLGYIFETKLISSLIYKVSSVRMWGCEDVKKGGCGVCTVIQARPDSKEWLCSGRCCTKVLSPQLLCSYCHPCSSWMCRPSEMSLWSVSLKLVSMYVANNLVGGDNTLHSLVSRPLPFSFFSLVFPERKPKNENEGGLGTTL